MEEQFRLGAAVHCSDGKCGEIIGFIVDPITKSMTHIAVHHRHHLDESEWLVPIDAVTSATYDEVHLACSQAEMTAMEPFIKTRYVDRPHPDYADYQSGEYMAPYVTDGAGGAVAEDYEAVPRGEFAIHRGYSVIAADGPIGHVGELVVDPEGGRVTHIVLQEGHLWGKREIAVPVPEIERADAGEVRLKLDKASVEALADFEVKRHYDTRK